MICEHVIMKRTDGQRPKRNAENRLIVLFLVLVGGLFLLNWTPKSVAAEAQEQAVETPNGAGEVQKEAAAPQEQPSEASAPAEEEKGTFDSIKGVFSSWGHKAGVEKDKLSIKYDMRKLRGKIEDDYQELGRVFFELYRDGVPDLMNDPKLTNVLGSLVEKQAELEKLEARLAELRADGEDEESAEEPGPAEEQKSAPAEEKPAY